MRAKIEWGCHAHLFFPELEACDCYQFHLHTKIGKEEERGPDSWTWSSQLMPIWKWTPQLSCFTCQCPLSFGPLKTSLRGFWIFVFLSLSIVRFHAPTFLTWQKQRPTLLGWHYLQTLIRPNLFKNHIINLCHRQPFMYVTTFWCVISL